MCFLDCIPRGCSRSHAVVRVVLYRCFISTSAAPSTPPDMNHIRGLECVPPCRYLPVQVNKPPPEPKPPSNRRATAARVPKLLRAPSGPPGLSRPLSIHFNHGPPSIVSTAGKFALMRPPAKLTIDVTQQGPRRGRKDDDRQHRDRQSPTP